MGLNNNVVYPVMLCKVKLCLAILAWKNKMHTAQTYFTMYTVIQELLNNISSH